MDQLYEYMLRQLAQTPDSFRRYIYDSINWDNRMLGLVGPRGVGKTTLFLQRIKEAHSTRDALYVSADHLYFSTHSLYGVAERLYQDGGSHLFIDEVHKYPNWSHELKMMFDSLPGLHVYFTGSSVLDIERGDADLSRRAPRYEMQGLSFREYLAIRHGIEVPVRPLDDILAGDAGLPGVEHPLPLFRDYLRRGYSDASMNTNEWIWNLSASKAFGKKKNWLLRLRSFDLLQQLKQTYRTVNAQGTYETWYNTVPAYASLHLTYRFDMKPKKQAGKK